MTAAESQLVSGKSIPRAAVLFPAGALIFLGTVIQLGMLGYEHAASPNLWPVSMIVEAAWNLLAARLNLSGYALICEFWPSLLVAAGIAMLLPLVLNGPSRDHSIPPKGEKPGV
ncbi:MAG TPA: hypothetical protein VN822_03135 [Candidatus Acidoferrales bacterium]|nr:hypothetical protein [Candidatus Acidoferrales bacterium]